MWTKTQEEKYVPALQINRSPAGDLELIQGGEAVVADADGVLALREAGTCFNLGKGYAMEGNADCLVVGEGFKALNETPMACRRVTAISGSWFGCGLTGWWPRKHAVASRRQGPRKGGRWRRCSIVVSAIAGVSRGY